MIVTNDQALARRMQLFHDKAWGYGDPNPDHYFLALNYRMTELQGAVALAQLKKLEGVVRQRQILAETFTHKIEGIKGIFTPKVTPGGTHVYWKYPLWMDPEILKAEVTEFAEKLKLAGISSAPRYIQKPAFMCEVLRERKTFGTSRFPFEGPYRKGEPLIEYRPEEYPGAFLGLSRVLVLPWNERYTNEHIEFIAEQIRQTVTFFKRKDSL